jgi:glucose/arabinose dehydrogenase
MRKLHIFLGGCVALAMGCGDDGSGTPPVDGGGGTDSGPGMDGGGVDSGPTPDGGGVDSPTPEDGGGDAFVPPPPCEPPVLPALTTEEIVAGHNFSAPVFVGQAPGVTDTLWVVEQRGRILLVRDGAVVGTPFLDIRTSTDYGGERGLLGLAFHPDYATNRRFFVYYTPNSAHQNVVAEYQRSMDDPDVADPTEVQRLMEVTDPEDNHDGGMLAFGPDGFLYVGTGDGGGGGDNHGTYGNGLNTDVLLGKILRLDVDGTAPFAAAGNPFEGGGGLPQIWAYGLRNPWRFSFDRATGDLYIADVGQGDWEEVDIQPASSTGGENYGWRAYEGFAVYRAGDVDRVPVHAEPVLVVEHDTTTDLLRGACSITGGYVYQGSAIPDLRGVYLFGDYCSDDIGAFRWCEGAVMGDQRVADLRGVGNGIASFGEDNAGEMYMAFVQDGTVVKIVPAP